MGELYQKLTEYAKSDYYPYHMPGHKRQNRGNPLADVTGLDITEIEGFDDLHAPSGILERLQKKAAAAYGAEESFYLINGSTAGVLSAISAAVPEGGKLLMARGCHRSAYHAVYLRRLKPVYLWTPLHPVFGCQMPVTPDQVKEALEAEERIHAVLVVSPTYEGLMADIADIAEVVHQKGLPLIVDEAHGAHLGFHPFWKENSNRLGADLVIHSLHKTLFAPTQTALLHVNGDRIDRERLRRFLRIYQSSSPSYLFMAGIEEAIEKAAEGKDLFDAFKGNWLWLLGQLEACNNLAFLQEENLDAGKLVIADRTGSLTGKQLYDRLLRDYHLQMEMAAGNYVLAMFTVGDTKEGYERLAKALLEIDRTCTENTAVKKWNSRGLLSESGSPLWSAWDADKREIPLVEAKGHMAGDFICLYPPGSPLVVPGEYLTKEVCDYLENTVACGYTLQGITFKQGVPYIKIL